MNNTLTAFSAAILLTTTLAVGCSAPPETVETEGSSTSSITGPDSDATGGSCGDAVPNPSCNEKFFVEKAIELGQQDPIGEIAAPAGAAFGCVKGLVALGAVEIETGGAATIVAGAVLTAAGTIAACKTALDYLKRTGVFDNISCFLEPTRYTEATKQCLCQQQCNLGVDHDGTRFLDRTTTFAYGHLDRLGSANCYCTDDPKAVTCKLDCREWASADPSNCGCRSLD